MYEQNKLRNAVMTIVEFVQNCPPALLNAGLVPLAVGVLGICGIIWIAISLKDASVLIAGTLFLAATGYGIVLIAGLKLGIIEEHIVKCIDVSKSKTLFSLIVAGSTTARFLEYDSNITYITETRNGKCDFLEGQDYRIYTFKDTTTGVLASELVCKAKDRKD